MGIEHHAKYFKNYYKPQNNLNCLHFMPFIQIKSLVLRDIEVLVKNLIAVVCKSQNQTQDTRPMFLAATLDDIIIFLFFLSGKHYKLCCAHFHMR